MFDTTTTTTQDTDTRLQFRPRTYAELLPDLKAEEAGLFRDVPQGEKWIAEYLDPPPAERELFLVFCLTTWGGWRAIYLNYSTMTRFFAVRCARALADPSVTEMRIFRGEPDTLYPAVRAWRQQNGVTQLNHI